MEGATDRVSDGKEGEMQIQGGESGVPLECGEWKELYDSGLAFRGSVVYVYLWQ